MGSLDQLVETACDRIRECDLVGAHTILREVVQRARPIGRRRRRRLPLQLEAYLVLVGKALQDAGFDVTPGPAEDLAVTLTRAPDATRQLEEFAKHVDAMFRAASTREPGTPVAERAKRYMVANFHRSITTKDIAEAMRCSAAYLRQVFKKTYGQSARDYLLELRLRRAKQLLRQTSLPIAEIGRRSGFGSGAYKNRRHRVLLLRDLGIRKDAHLMAALEGVVA